MTDLFQPFPKMARLTREVIVTEKIDGSNAQVIIQPLNAETDIDCTPVTVVDGLALYAGSRTRLITPGKTTDNFGFAAWVHENAPALVRLGHGRHFGEWYGKGIQRGYGLDHRRFALFNASRWTNAKDAQAGDEVPPACCEVVPVLYRGEFDTAVIEQELHTMRRIGSWAVPGFANPEGLIVWHTAANIGFKKTLDGDDHKGQPRE